MQNIIFSKSYPCGRKIGIIFKESESLLLNENKSITSPESSEYKKDVKKYINNKDHQNFIKIIDSNTIFEKDDLVYLLKEGFKPNTGEEQTIRIMAENLLILLKDKYKVVKRRDVQGEIKPLEDIFIEQLELIECLERFLGNYIFNAPK